MPVPTHAIGCKTFLRRTRCPDCQADVWFFGCSCGSRVFFEQPGAPWREHKDACIPYLVRYLRDVERMPYQGIRTIIKQCARDSDLEVPPSVWRELSGMERRELGGETILRVSPCEDEAVVSGSIVSANLQVNVLRRMGYDNNPIARGLFRKLLEEALAEVTVRSVRDGTTGFVDEFTFYIKLREFKRLGLRTGMRVGCILNPHRLADDTIVWLAADVRPL